MKTGHVRNMIVLSTSHFFIFSQKQRALNEKNTAISLCPFFVCGFFILSGRKINETCEFLKIIHMAGSNICDGNTIFGCVLYAIFWQCMVSVHELLTLEEAAHHQFRRFM